MLEFTLVGIAMIFVLISLFEISRGLWAYHTLAYAIREGTRYAAMHGTDCATPNTCQVTIGQIVTVIQNAGGGFDPGNTTLTFTPLNSAATTGTLTNLSSNNTVFPPSGSNGLGQQVSIKADYGFRTILAILWVGDGGPVNDSQTFHLKVSSAEPVQF